MNIPENLKYTKEHEWVRVEDNATVTIGITDFAQGELGDIVYIDVDTLNENIAQNEVFGSIEAVKTVSDLFMPVSGEIIAFNENLEDVPETVNKSPYEKGWIIKVKLEDTKQLEDLLSASDYKTLIKN